MKVVPAHHYARWTATVAVAVRAAQFVHGMATNPVWEWAVFGDYVLSETIVRAVWVTLQPTAYATVLGFLLGTVLAFMRLSRSPLLQTVAWTYIWIFRSIPMIVQPAFWFNLSALYKELGVGVPFGPVFWSVDSNSLIGTIGAAVIGLTLHQAAYAAEIVRGGVVSVDPGQLEAAAALGIPRLRQIRRIVLPQAMRAILPTAGNEIIGLLKGTSVVYVMSIGELFYQVQVIYGRNGRVIPLLLVKRNSGLKIAGAEDVAGRTVAVSSGTNQEKLLIEWSKDNEKAGREPVDIKYYQNDSDMHLGLQSGRIDLYLGPSPTSAYYAATTGKPRSSARTPVAAPPSRASSRPPRRRAAAWSTRSPARSTRSSTTVRTPRCWSAGG
ncbi:hypothetical protein SHIRM173S_11433 [Streptomyces hirsutus]